MRFFFLSVVALCLDGVVGAIILLPRIHQFELIPAGNTSSSETPAGKITSVDPLAGVIYLEKSKEIESVYVELFSSYKYSNDPALCTGSPFLNATAGVLTNVTDKYTRTKSDSIIRKFVTVIMLHVFGLNTPQWIALFTFSLSYLSNF
mmetsp:Transcript_24346/g.53295  ORF Transcript_24346/g.53295 Transcript_24346/m.53295 type:complete len:148 (-) Transcript_24346:546-989(-)